MEIRYSGESFISQSFIRLAVVDSIDFKQAYVQRQAQLTAIRPPALQTAQDTETERRQKELCQGSYGLQSAARRLRPRSRRDPWERPFRDGRFHAMDRRESEGVRAF